MNDTPTTGQPSELELQLFLAKELEGEIGYSKVVEYFYWKTDTVPNTYVTPREWDYIVRRVEEKLTDEQRAEYGVKLWTRHWCGSPWSTSAIALRKVLGNGGV